MISFETSDERELRTWIEQTEAAESVFADRLAAVCIEDVDEHVFFRMAGEKTRKDFDELFLLGCAGAYETIANIKPVWPFRAIQAHPIARAIAPHFVEPFAVFRDPRVDFLEA